MYREVVGRNKNKIKILLYLCPRCSRSTTYNCVPGALVAPPYNCVTGALLAPPFNCVTGALVAPPYNCVTGALVAPPSIVSLVLS